nr:peptidase C39 family protein [uncultured Methanoregula sp.]
MPDTHGASIHLDVPFFRQHYGYTCGPASLMMAMKYWCRDIRLGKYLEIDLWREGTLAAVPGTSRFGLAYSAAARGFSVRVTSNTGGLDFVENLDPPPEDLEMQWIREQFSERRARCRKSGVRERHTTITAATIRESLFSNHVPLIVINSLFFCNEDIPHWIVVTGIDDKFLYFNNPIDAAPRKRKTGLFGLGEFIGYHGSQSMVEIWRH